MSYYTNITHLVCGNDVHRDHRTKTDADVDIEDEIVGEAVE